jgi:hypothetical protein
VPLFIRQWGEEGKLENGVTVTEGEPVRLYTVAGLYCGRRTRDAIEMEGQFCGRPGSVLDGTRATLIIYRSPWLVAS